MKKLKTYSDFMNASDEELQAYIEKKRRKENSSFSKSLARGGFALTFPSLTLFTGLVNIFTHAKKKGIIPSKKSNLKHK